MDLRTLSVIALSNRDFPSLHAKLEEAARWIRYAAQQSADLVILPELLNFYRGDGPGNPNALPFRETALTDWTVELEFFAALARECRLAIVVPLLIAEDGTLANVAFLVSKTGDIIGRFQKVHPTPSERKDGVRAGEVTTLDWDGVPMAGAICFDTHFVSVFSNAAARGARLLVVPSLWNGGPWLAGMAARYSLPIAVSFPDWSRIIDLDGRTLAEGGYRQESLRYGAGAPVFTATLNFDREVFHLSNQAHHIVAIQNQYGPAVTVRMLHEQAAFSIESRSPRVTVKEIIADTGLIPFRDFLHSAEHPPEETASIHRERF